MAKKKENFIQSSRSPWLKLSLGLLTLFEGISAGFFAKNFQGVDRVVQGFQYGIPLLIFGATGDHQMLRSDKKNNLEKMAHHVTHFGVHDLEINQ